MASMLEVEQSRNRKEKVTNHEKEYIKSGAQPLFQDWSTRLTGINTELKPHQQFPPQLL